MSYTSDDVRLEADAYREWARRRDREQFIETVANKLKTYNEMTYYENVVRVKK